MDTIELEPKHIPVAGSADVVVAGGRPGRSVRRNRRRRSGSRYFADRGGRLSRRSVDFRGVGVDSQDAEDKPSGTLLARIVRTLRRRGELEFAGDGTPAFNIEAMKALLDEFCMEAG